MMAAGILIACAGFAWFQKTRKGFAICVSAAYADMTGKIELADRIDNAITLADRIDNAITFAVYSSREFHCPFIFETTFAFEGLA